MLHDLGSDLGRALGHIAQLANCVLSKAAHVLSKAAYVTHRATSDIRDCRHGSVCQSSRIGEQSTCALGKGARGTRHCGTGTRHEIACIRNERACVEVTKFSCDRSGAVFEHATDRACDASSLLSGLMGHFTDRTAAQPSWLR